ncbi:Afadin- and alpha -actinin-Binding [Microdochium nivale]|nr:Afadin- and alpha -actinin-Binding [Microdochium nivale]
MASSGEMENLRTASLYINNQLLSRGLLRDGQSIDFANPACNEHGGLPAAMGRIMSVVNDLILKRDRDAEHRESLSSTLRNLRAETLRQTTDYTRQADRLAEAQRRVDGADTAERALRAQLKAAEATVHRMKDEAHKMKTLVAQTRSGCANEVRKRDRQIEALKKTVTDAARVRGGARSRDVVTISVTGDFGDEAGGVGPGLTADAEYSLRMETNEFLTRLARGLSEENELLVNIVRQMVDNLREMSGLEAELVGGGGSTAGKGAEELASELETIIQHLRNILTNPSFVPIEELEARDEEIARLRAGFEKMETRWKDAVRMIDGWRRRMGSGGKSVDMEELSMGLRLSPVRLRDIAVETAGVGVERVDSMELSCVQEEDEEDEEEEHFRHRVPAYTSPTKKGKTVTVEQSRVRLPSPVAAVELVTARTSQEEVEAVPYDEEVDDLDSSSIYDEDEDLLDLEEGDEVEEPNFEVLQVSTATSVSSPPMPERPQLSPLKDSFSAGNKQPSEERQQQPLPPSRKRVGDFSAAASSSSSLSDGQSPDVISDTSSKNLDEDRRREKREPVPPSRNTRLAARRSLEKSAESFEVAYESPHFGKSSEKASSELRLFSKPAAPAFVSAKPKPGTTAPTTTATKTKTKAVAVARAKPTPPSTQRSTRRTAPTKTVTPVVVVEEVQEEKPEGPAEKKLRRSLPESEPDNDASSDSAAPPQSHTSEMGPAVPTPAGSRGRNKALQPVKPTAAVAPPPKTSPQPAQQPRNRSPIRPQGGTRLLPPQRKKMPAMPQSPMTMEAITAKLAASEREADAARVRAKLKAARFGRRGGDAAAAAAGPDIETAAAAEPTLSRPASPARSQESARKARVRSPIKIVELKQNEDDDNNKKDDVEAAPKDRDMPDELASMGTADELVEPEQHQHNNNRIEVVKRKRDRLLSQATNRRASRRRSTLSSWELEGLIAGNVGPASPSK